MPSHPSNYIWYQILIGRSFVIKQTWVLALFSICLQSNLLSPFSVWHGSMSITNIYIVPAPYNGITMTILLGP